MKRLFFLITALFFFVWIGGVSGTMTGGEYEIYADSFSVLEDDSTSGGGFQLSYTGGEFFAQNASGGSYILRGGFQAMERGSLGLTLSTSSLSLGQLSTTTVVSTSLIMTVTSDSDTGYGVSLTEDQNLCRDPGSCNTDAFNIDDVADGVEVTAGTEGYGVRTDGGAGILAADVAIDADGVAIASTPNVVENQQTTVIFQVSLATAKSRAGDYSHDVTFTASANP